MGTSINNVLEYCYFFIYWGNSFQVIVGYLLQTSLSTEN